ncbi:MAG: DMT family transporter [Stellaceae bacterium]
MSASPDLAASPVAARRLIYPYTLLLLANLAWASNWVVGRALHDAFPPVALSFWRWGVAALVLAPFAIPRLKGRWHVVWRRRWLLLVLGATGVATFQAIIYAGLDYTTAVNATILNAGSPLVMVLMVWLIERQPATRRQWLGMGVTFIGVLLIVARGDWHNLAQLKIDRGDLLIFGSIPLWCLYSVLVRRRPVELDAIGFMFVLMLIGLTVLSPAYFYESLFVRVPDWSWPVAGLILFIAVTSSILAYLFWNRGVELVGANRAGFTTPFQPALTAILAVLLLGEPFHLYDALGFAIILAGWLLTTGLKRATR